MEEDIAMAALELEVMKALFLRGTFAVYGLVA
jgi:hypothetical protein